MMFRSVLSVTLVISFAGTAFAQQPATVSDQEAQQIAESLAKDSGSAWTSGNATGVANQFSDNGFWSTGAGRVLSNRQVIEQAVANRIQAGWTKETVTVTQAHATGPEIWCFGEYMLTGSGPADGKHLRGQFGEVLTRTGHEWRIRMMVSNITLKLPNTQPAAVAPHAAPLQ